MKKRRFGTDGPSCASTSASRFPSSAFPKAIAIYLMSVSAIAETSEVDGEKRKKISHDLRSIGVCLEFFKVNAGTWPTTEQGLSVLVEKPKFGNGMKGWRRCIKALPVDPWGQHYFYRLVDRKAELDSRHFVLKSLGPDGVESDDIER